MTSDQITVGRASGETSAKACRVYGFVPAGTSPPDLEGTSAEGRDIQLVECDKAAALVEFVDPDHVAVTRKDLVAHSLVLNAVAANGGPVIPARFGSVVANRDAVLDDLLTPRHDYWTGQLDELRGLSQFTLRGRYVQDAVLSEIVEESPRIAELRERTAGRPEEERYAERVRLGELVSSAIDAKRSADVEALMDSLSAHSVMERSSPGSGLDHVVDLAFLVRDDQRQAFEQAAESLAEQVHERIVLRLLGPLAPFDFVPEA